MRTSENVNELFAALSAAQGKMQNPEKNRTVTIQPKNGPKYSYNYADLPKTFDCNRTILAEHGLTHTCAPNIKDATYILTCRLGHSSGQWIEADWPLFINDDPKSIAASITYGTRYLFNCLTGISGDEDLDGAPEQDATYQPREPQKPIQPVAQTQGHQKPTQTNAIAPKTAPAPRLVAEAQVKFFHTMASKHGLTPQDVKQMLLQRFKVESSKDLTMDVFNDALAALNTMGDVP